MIYEQRIYECVPGRLPALLNRFATITLKLWEKHGIRQVGFWTVMIGATNHDLYYLLEWESLAERENLLGVPGAVIGAGLDENDVPSRFTQDQHIALVLDSVNRANTLAVGEADRRGGMSHLRLRANGDIELLLLQHNEVTTGLAGIFPEHDD